jgi:hypothetical protein
MVKWRVNRRFENHLWLKFTMSVMHNAGRLVPVATKFCMVASNIHRHRYGICLMSRIRYVEFWSVSLTFGKFIHPCITLFYNGLSWRTEVSVTVDGPGIEFRQQQDFLARPVRPPRPPPPPVSCTMGTGTSPGISQPGRDADHPPPSITEVTTGFQLYLRLCPVHAPAWHGVTFTLTIIQMGHVLLDVVIFNKTMYVQRSIEVRSKITVAVEKQ